MGVQIPGAWQGVPTQAQIPAAQQIAQGVGSALPQAAGVVAYPMQQFQVSPQVSESPTVIAVPRKCRTENNVRLSIVCRDFSQFESETNKHEGFLVGKFQQK